MNQILWLISSRGWLGYKVEISILKPLILKEEDVLKNERCRGKLVHGWDLNPVDTVRKLNVHKTFRRCPGRLLNVLCTFNLRPLSTGKYLG